MDEDQRTDAAVRLLGEYVRQVTDEVVTPAFTPGSPGRMRRRRTRRGRRILAVVFATVAVISAVGLVIAYGPRGSVTGSDTGITGHPGRHTHAGAVDVRSVDFNGSFQPAEEIGAGRALWLIGAGPTSGTAGTCRIARLDPAALSMKTFGLAACGMNVVAGPGELFLETETSRPDNSHLIHIETFSLADHTSTVLSPVAMTVFGSEIAHTQLAYADGWLWLYGYTDTAEVVQISPTTGAAVRTVADVPAIGGTEPLVSAGPGGGIWLAGGAGGASAPAFISASPNAGGVVREYASLGQSATLEWLAPVAGRMWVGVAEASSTPTLHQPLTERIVSLNRFGDVVKRSPVEDFGQVPVAVAGRFFTAGPGAGCASQPIWEVHPATLRTSVVTTLHPANPCNDAGYRSVAGAARSLFVLDAAGGSNPAVVYRIRPK